MQNKIETISDLQAVKSTLQEKIEKAMATFNFADTGYCFDNSPGRIIYFYFNPKMFFKYIRPVRKE